VSTGPNSGSGPKILLLDIESSPHKVWSFRMFKTVIYPDSIIEPSRLICFSAKWEDGKIIFRSEYHHGYVETLQVIRDLLDECDVAVAYNGDRFDYPRLRQQFRLNDIAYPRPFIQVDPFKTIKKLEQWPSLKLDYVAGALGLSRKQDPGGLILWRECLGDFGEDRQRRAWNKMRRYSKQDVVVLQEVFDKYRNEIPNLPHLALYAPETPSVALPDCPRCLSTSVTRQGYRRTKTRRYPRFQCRDCASWFSQTRSDMGVTGA